MSTQVNTGAQTCQVHTGIQAYILVCTHIYAQSFLLSPLSSLSVVLNLGSENPAQGAGEAE